VTIHRGDDLSVEMNGCAAPPQGLDDPGGRAFRNLGHYAGLGLDEMKAQLTSPDMRVKRKEVFGEGQEMVILVTELTINPYASRFLSRYGSEAYFRHNKELLFYERQKEIIAEMENLNI
jgi:hypothetical protein